MHHSHPSRKTQITVIGDSHPSPETYAIGLQTGKMLAQLGAVIITGGMGGVMKAVSEGARQAGGTCIGIIPSNEFSEANTYNSIIIPTDIGHARNSITVLSADIVIAIGGGAGTLCELTYAWIYKKTIFASREVNGWARKVADTALDDRRKDLIIGFDDLEELKVKLTPLID